MSFEILKHEAVGKFLSAFPASLESLKREALKAFQCASTVKAVLKNTGMLAGAALAEISVSFRRWSFTASLKTHFASLRSDLLYKVKRFFVIFQCVC